MERREWRHVLLCRGSRKYSPVAELGDKSGNRIKFPIKGCCRVPFVSSSKEPDEENLKSGSVRGGKAVMQGMRIMRHIKGKPRNRLWRSLNKAAYPSTRLKIIINFEKVCK